MCRPSVDGRHANRRRDMAEIAVNLKALADRWSVAGAGERANLQMYVIEMCEALLIERPRPKGSGYEFELQIDAITVAGTVSSNFIDCWKAGHFALEGKDDAADRAGKAANEALLRRAYGQVRNYVHHVPGATPPPYLMVLDVGTTLIVWDRWAGTYGGFEAGRRIDLRTLHTRPDDIALLRDIWENPAARDRRGAAQAVTTEIAGRLAELAAAHASTGAVSPTATILQTTTNATCHAAIQPTHARLADSDGTGDARNAGVRPPRRDRTPVRRCVGRSGRGLRR